MHELYGEFEAALDAKGRFMLPTAYRKGITGEIDDKGEAAFVVKRGFEQCLNLYPIKAWNAEYARIAHLDDFFPEVRDFKRMFLNGATTVMLDSAGRLLINKGLQEYAGLGKDLVISIQGAYAEIWNKETYTGYLQSRSASFSDLAKQIASGNFSKPSTGA